MGLEDVDPGDEMNRYGDYVYLEHDEQAGGAYAPVEGDAVSLDANGVLKKAEEGENVIGILYTYPYFGDSGGSAGGDTIDQDQPATVKTQGTVKAHVTANVSAGSALGAPDVTNGAAAGELDDDGQTNTDDQGFEALSDPVTEDGEEYANVLLR